MTSHLDPTASSELFDISIDIGARVISPTGEATRNTAPLLLAAARSFCDRVPVISTLDLAGVTDPDPSLLDAIKENADNLNADLWVINPTAAIKRRPVTFARGPRMQRLPIGTCGDAEFRPADTAAPYWLPSSDIDGPRERSSQTGIRRMLIPVWDCGG